MDEFDRSFGGIHTSAALLGLLSLPVFVGVSRRARKAIAANPALTRHPLALTRPVSAWLLLWLAMLLLINFLGPTTMLKALLALAWLPIMRLQPERMRDLLGGWIYLSGVFLLLHLLGQLIGGLTLLYRLVVLLNGLLMLAALGGLLWRLRRAAAPPRSRLRRTVHWLTVAGSAAIAAAVLANLVGNITLAAMLTDATLISAYIGLFLLAAGSVVRSWAAFVFRPAARRLMSEADHAGGLLQVVSRALRLRPDAGLAVRHARCISRAAAAAGVAGGGLRVPCRVRQPGDHRRAARRCSASRSTCRSGWRRRCAACCPRTCCRA